MKILNRKSNKLVLIAFSLLVSVLGCKRDDYNYSISNGVNITGYLENHADQFSMLSDILQRSGTASYLGAYGTYTLFAPNNDAVTAWLKSKGKNSVAEVDPAELKKMVLYHLIKDTISTASFTDGKLQTITMYGQYLFTGASNVSGVTTYTINKTSRVLQTNIRVGNGVIHQIDKVLEPPFLTLARLIESDPGYSIFTQALKETGFYDTLNKVDNPDTTRKFLTVIAQTDSVFNAAGISSYAQLKDKYATTDKPTNHDDSLWLFVAYRIIPGANYLADIAGASSFNTVAPLEIITTKLKGQTLLINDDDFNGVHENGVPIDRTRSDNQAVNGVFHSVSQSYKIKVRSPTPVYFDLGDQPELRAMTSVWRKPGASVSIGAGKSICAGINLPNSSATVSSTYWVESSTSSNYYAYNDGMSIAIGDGNNNRHKYVDFTTPIIIKGRYKVWLCFRTGNLANLQATIDPGTANEVILPNIAVLYTYLSGVVTLSDPNSDNLLESQGYKRYSAAPATNANHPARLMGTVEIKTTSRHVVRLTKVGGRDGSATLDMIHFIPVDMDQQYPRFGKDGTIIQRPQ